MRTLVIFDIDGTLLSARNVPEKAFNSAFYELFAVQDAWGQTQAHGRTDPLIIDEIAQRVLERSLSLAEFEDLCTNYLKHFELLLMTEDPFARYPGVDELLKVLNETPEVALGIETGNLEGAAKLKLEHAGISSYFHFGGYSSDSAERANIIAAAIERGRQWLHVEAENSFDRTISTEVGKVIVLGDSVNDVRAAKANHKPTDSDAPLLVRSVAVSTGRDSSATLAAEEPDLLLENFEDPVALFTLISEKV